MNYLPNPGDIVKMRAWYGIVLDVFKNKASVLVLGFFVFGNIMSKT